MLIKSFLAIPKSGQFEKLSTYIKQFSNCSITSPSNSEDVLVIVTENKNQQEEDQFLSKLHNSLALEHVVLVSSFNATV